MPRLPYRATAADGRVVEDFVDAVSAREAVEQLQARGLSQVQLLEEPALAEQHDQAAADTVPLPDIARLHAAMTRPGSGLLTVWKQVLRGARWWLAFGLLLVLFGLFKANGFFTLLGAAMLVLPFALSGLSWRHVARYEAFLRASAHGRRAEMQRLASLLRGAVKDAGLQFDLAVHEAGFVAREQGLDAALAMVEPHRDAVAQRAPEMFNARVALLHLAADDAEGFVRLMQQACEDSGRDPSRALDAALAHARCGDPAQARALLDGVDTRLLPALAESFHAWTCGVLARHEDGDGREAFSRALAGFSEHARLPAVWSAVATCGCDAALELARHGQHAAAHELLATVWPVARIHLDTATRQALASTFPDGPEPSVSDS